MAIRTPGISFVAVLSALALCLAPTLEAQIASGKYTGNSGSNPITGLGFQPDVVIIKAADATRYAVIRTSTMTDITNNTKQFFPTALLGNRITSLDPDGFSLGTSGDVNLSDLPPITYHWIAFKAVPGQLKVGSYPGNGADFHSITGVGFQPDYVIVMPANNSTCFQRSAAMVGDTSYEFDAAGAVSDHIQAFEPDGFQVGLSVDVNASGVTYHYAAWKALPGKMAVGSYPGDGFDNRPVPVGFRPEYVLIKRDGLDSACHKSFSTGIAVDTTLHFANLANEADHIQALEANGFQVGKHQRVNLSGNYFWAAWGAGEGCTPLSTTEAAGSITVTAPSSFEMRFDKTTGGGIEKFFDLAEDPARSVDLAGGNLLLNKALFTDEIWGGALGYNTDQNTLGPKLDLLEATATRVRVRQEAFYQERGGSNILGGLKGIGDYSVYPSGRMALRWNRKATTPVTYFSHFLDFVVHLGSSPPLDTWAWYSETDGTPSNAGDDDFLLIRNEAAGARTDFLHVLYKDWTVANGYVETADSTDRVLNGAQEWLLGDWGEMTGATIPTDSNEVWSLLSYFKPTNFVDHLDPEVKTRRDDYRLPDALAISVGSSWNDAAENTAGDDFNESEAAYLLTFDPASGLTFAIDGIVANPRYHPFFKIRQWRSLQDPPSVTLQGVPLTNDLDYRADVKPISRGHFAWIVQWHSTFEDPVAVTTPDVGPAGTINGTATFASGRPGSGNGILLDAAGENVSFPSTPSTFDRQEGAIEFWYQPNYDHTDGVQHVLFVNFGDATHSFTLEKSLTNALRFRIRNAATLTEVSVTSANYRWKANEWVHIRASWNGGVAIGDQVRLFVNGVEPAHTDPANPHDPATMIVGTNYIGSDAAGGSTGAGVFDEFHLYGGSGSSNAPWLLAAGGLKTNSSEYLADSGRNFTLSFNGVNGVRQGEYLYLGADSKFRGLNVAMKTPGAGAAQDLQWQYWSPTGWRNLESIAGFTDLTNSLTRNGNIYWTSDPIGWELYSVNGGPDLYYVRAYLASGDYAGGFPVEGLIKTDILLFQYCGDITAPAQTFSFSTPVPTAVELLSFEARGVDGAVELTWETAAEVENLGFYLYRGSSEQGPWDRITPTLIPGLGSSPLGARYRYRDSGLANGKTYFYLLEDVETGGERTQHGPVSATPQPRASLPTIPPSAPTAGIVYGKPEETSFRVLVSDRNGMTVELLTGGFTAEPQADGSVRLSVPGFVEEQGSIPVKRVWLEAVVGRKVRITSVQAGEVAEFSSLRPKGAEIPEVIAAQGVVRAGSRASPRQGSYPEEWARVVSLAFQAEVKKALLELAPIRWDGTKLLLARRLVVRVAFAGREVGERSLGGSRGRRHRELLSHGQGRVAARLLVKQRGLYGVRFEEVGGRAVPADRLRLSRQGKPVAYHLDARRFGPGSVLYFFSEGASLNPYGEEAVYELTVGEQALWVGEQALWMPLAEARPWGAPAGWYWQRLEREENRIYQPALLEAGEPWFWDTILSPMTKSYPFAASGLASAGESARLELWLQGASDFAACPDHHVRVYVNGSLVAEDSWDGKKPRKLQAELGTGVLVEGANELSVENVGDTEAVSSMVMLERFAVVYPRLSVVEGGVLEGGWSESGVAEIQGLAGRVLVLDVTEEPPRWLTAVEGARFRAEAGRRYLAVGADSVLKPGVSRPAPARLKSERNVAEYLVVGPEELLLEAAPLLELRRSQGLRTKAVSIEEVYSEFGYGEERPEAIRDFLAYAYHHWAKPSPRYVLLLGDATYDFKDYLRTGVKNQVPPYLMKTSYWLTASDPTYASVNGEDVLPDLAIGRLPARTPEEARVLVEKIVSYETGGASLQGRTVLVVDNPDRAGNFEADAEEIASSLLAERPVEMIRVSELGRDGTRAAIRDAFDRGPSLMSYLGHGAILVWASENVFNNMDVRSLSVQDQQPFLLTMNCLNGYFHFPYLNSLAEELLKAERRGAIAAFSPSGLSLNGPAHRYHKALLSELLSGKRERLGDVVLAAQAAFAESGEFLELLSIYHLLGDPALRVR